MKRTLRLARAILHFEEVKMDTFHSNMKRTLRLARTRHTAFWRGQVGLLSFKYETNFKSSTRHTEFWSGQDGLLSFRYERLKRPLRLARAILHFEEVKMDSSHSNMKRTLSLARAILHFEVDSWGWFAVITMPTQKQRLVNLTQTARHEVKMDTSTFLILTHWSPGLFFPRSDRGFRTLGGPWSSIISTHLRPIIILRFSRQKTAHVIYSTMLHIGCDNVPKVLKSMCHYHPRILQAKNCPRGQFSAWKI